MIVCRFVFRSPYECVLRNCMLEYSYVLRNLSQEKCKFPSPTYVRYRNCSESYFSQNSFTFLEGSIHSWNMHFFSYVLPADLFCRSMKFVQMIYLFLKKEFISHVFHYIQWKYKQNKAKIRNFLQKIPNEPIYIQSSLLEIKTKKNP